MTNVRRCMGPEKESPEIRRASIAHCVAAYLQKEIEMLPNLRAVHGMGADAAKVLVGSGNSIKLHGAAFGVREAAAMRYSASLGAERDEEGEDASPIPD